MTPNPRLKLRRWSTGDQGTRGILWGAGFWCHTLELPWRDNAPNVSCIPAGVYDLAYVTALRSFGGRRDLYLVQDVEARSGILLHAGTFAGDKALDWRTDSWGCPLLGMTIGTLQGQTAIFRSREAVDRLIRYLGGKPATLIIEEAYHVRLAG